MVFLATASCLVHYIIDIRTLNYLFEGDTEGVNNYNLQPSCQLHFGLDLATENEFRLNAVSPKQWHHPGIHLNLILKIMFLGSPAC